MRMLFATFVHWLAHLLRLNYDHPTAYWKAGVLMRAYVCNTCGEVRTAEPVKKASLADVLEARGRFDETGKPRGAIGTLVYWRIWCPRDPEWDARGVVWSEGRGWEWAMDKARQKAHSARLALRDRFGVEPPETWETVACDNDPYGAEHLRIAKGEYTPPSENGLLHMSIG